MKFNHHELALFASSRHGKADKEGVLWLREIDGTKVKKKQGYVQRWFTLSGNMLFYSKSDLQESGVVGMIILERCRVDPDNESGNRNAFKLVFDECDSGYLFAANSARDQDEWITALNSSSYEYLRTLFSDLRGQLLHLTGKDPLVEEHPYYNEPIKNVSPVPASAPAYEGEPVFELSLACSSLVGTLRDCVPSAMIVTSVMTPPQAYWIRYAQTEVVEHNCDPRFFTTVVFYMGTVAMATKLKFEVFDVYDRQETKVCPIGQAHCQVMGLLRSPDQSQRHDIIFDGAVCGYLTIKASKSQESDAYHGIHQPPLLRDSHAPQTSTLLTAGGVAIEGETRGSFNYRAAMDNIVIRTFQFPVNGKPDKSLKVTEVMGEGKHSFSLPMQLLDLYISEESELLSHYNSLSGLCEHWEIAKQDVMLEHNRLVQNYRESKSGLQAQFEAGITFKKSTAKSTQELDFVPVNLHIQQLKVVSEETENKDKVVYTAVTVGCPTAYSLKFKSGGLARMQNTSTLISGGSLGTTTDSKASRARGILGRIDTASTSAHSELQQLLVAANSVSMNGMTLSVRLVAEKVHQLKSICGVQLVNDSLRTFNSAQINQSTPPTELNASSLFHKIEEHVFCVEAKVDGLSSTVDTPTVTSCGLSEAVGNLTRVMDEVVSVFKKALYFVILKESHNLYVDKVPIGLKSLKHRHDIVFSQAVTTVATSFVFKLTQSMAVSSFLAQLIEVGYLMHWESLLSTMGDELGMLEDFIVAIHDLNNVKFKLCLAENLSDVPVVKGSRYKVIVEVPFQRALFRMLPTPLQQGREINVCVVLFTQGINEQQTLADRFGDNTLQDQINLRSLQQLTNYCSRYRDQFGSANAKLLNKSQKAAQLLEQLRAQVHSRKDKNVEILSLSQELCRTLHCGRVTSCKSAKDRTAMSVTLEQAHILVREMQMDIGCFQHAIDAMRSQGTRIRNTEKNVGVPLYAFNALQVFTLPPLYRPPDGTYKKLQT